MRIISGRFGGRIIRTAEGPGYRPATSKVRQSIFSMLEARGLEWPGLRAADLFAGSGSLAMEALSRGADFALFVEKAAKAAQLIRANLKELGVPASRFRVAVSDVVQLLRKGPDKPYNLLFIDPPYGQDLLAPALEAVLDKGWLAPGGFVLAEVEAALEPEDPAGLERITDRTYGQTRIVLWYLNIPGSPSIPEPLTR
ncbi:MAG: 16S rRNA (guanine(966)-N(2))-methyltransferase RsmD [Desulfovibrio sp.]